MQASRQMLSKEQITLLRLKYFDEANDAAYVFDFVDGRILDANDYLSKMLGYRREELLYMTVFDIHPKEEHKLMIELIELFKREGQVKGLTSMHLLRKDGTLIPVEKNGTLFRLNGRKVIQCTCRDISARVKAEEALRQERDFTRELIQTAKSAIIVINSDRTVRTVNKEASRLLGCTENDIIGRDWFDHFVPERFRDELKRSFVEILSGNTSFFELFDNPILTRLGEEIPMQWSNNTLRDENDRIVGILSIGQDVSDRKRFEGELNQRIEDMHIINSIALEVTSGLEIEELLPRITQNAVKLLNANAGALGLYDARKGALKYRYLFNLPGNLAHVEILRGTGLTSHVLETSQPVSISDYQEYPKAIKEFKEANVRATAIAPLLFENNLLGTLVIMHRDPEKRFSQYNISLLEAVARQAAIAIYNAQLFEEMKEEGEFRKALNQLTSLIGSMLDVHKVYDLICEEGTKLFKNSGTYLYTVDENKQLLKAQAAYGQRAREFMKIAIPISEPSLASHIFHTRKPALIDDAENNSIVKPEIASKFSSKTLMGTPIMVDDKVKGILIFASNEKPFFFNDVQLERAKLLSNQVAFAIRNADLYEQTKKALDHERYVALTLQKSLLPEKIPQIAGVDIGAYFAPMSANEALVGGDFYDVLQLTDGRVAIVIGDVSGKGIEAAAITAMVKYVMRSFIYNDPTPSLVLHQANTVVSRQLNMGSFVTLSYALFDPRTGCLTMANAGHPYPIYYSSINAQSKTLELSNQVFGLTLDYDFKQIELNLEHGDVLALYTDGLIEARANDQEFFGTERAQSTISKHHNLSAHHIALNLVNDCEAFAKGKLSDDIAILVLKRI